MNNKGQSLIMFVMLLPIILMLFAYIFDSAYIVSENNKLNEIAEKSLDYLNNDKDIEKVKNYIYKNNKNINIVEINNNYIHLKNDIKPIFGQYVGYDYYYLEAEFVASFDNGVLRIEEKG